LSQKNPFQSEGEEITGGLPRYGKRARSKGPVTFPGSVEMVDNLFEKKIDSNSHRLNTRTGCRDQQGTIRTRLLHALSPEKSIGRGKQPQVGREEESCKAVKKEIAAKAQEGRIEVRGKKGPKLGCAPDLLGKISSEGAQKRVAGRKGKIVGYDPLFGGSQEGNRGFTNQQRGSQLKRWSRLWSKKEQYLWGEENRPSSCCFY